MGDAQVQPRCSDVQVDLCRDLNGRISGSCLFHSQILLERIFVFIYLMILMFFLSFRLDLVISLCICKYVDVNARGTVLS